MENNSIQTNPQAQTMRKVSFFMNIAMGITVSIILSTHGVLASGHFSVPSLAISMVVSCSLALCIGFFLPVKPVKDKITANMKMPAKFLVANIITNIFYVLIITSVNTSLFITLAKHAMEVNNVPHSVPRPSILAALPKSLISSYIISYIVTLILEPIYIKIAFKKYGINPKAPGMAHEGKQEE